MFLYYRLVLHTLFREIEIMQHIFFCIEHSFPQCNVFKIYPCYYVWYSDFRGKKVILISTDFVSLSGYIFGVLEFLWQPYFQGTISRSDDIISTIFMDSRCLSKIYLNHWLTTRLCWHRMTYSKPEWKMKIRIKNLSRDISCGLLTLAVTTHGEKDSTI